MNNLLTALNGLISSLRSPHYQNGAPKGRGNQHIIRKKSGKTRRGATHKQGKVFLGRQLLAMTPAYYRRSHRGNPAKALREKMLLEKRKWISE